MSDLKTAKDSLVASLFELSKAAQDAASATVEFYKSTLSEDSEKTLAATLKNVQDATSVVSEAVQKAAPKKRVSKKAAAAAAKNSEESTIDTAATEVPEGVKSTKTKGKKKDENGTVSDEPTESSEASAGALVVPEKKKRKKVEKDPNAPKKPLTMYFAYSFHHRDLIREDRKKKDLPALPSSELSELVKKQWENISPEEKQEWQQKYQNQLKDYQAKKEAYATEKASNGDAASPVKESAISSSQSEAVAPSSPLKAPEDVTPSSPSKSSSVAVPVLSPLKKESKKRSKKTSEEKEEKKSKKAKKLASQSSNV
ncbi:transcriptional regulator Hmo1p [[Candida] anglica]|uniref:Transcriptional regulator Hmo1p n=1 Tax=[Candida] anglica TaxID=148631 RepID=A0ABP0EQN3_9ASCO